MTARLAKSRFPAENALEVPFEQGETLSKYFDTSHRKVSKAIKRILQPSRRLSHPSQTPCL